MSTVVPSIAGPKRPQDKVLLTESAKAFLPKPLKKIQKDKIYKEEPVSGELILN